MLVIFDDGEVFRYKRDDQFLLLDFRRVPIGLRHHTRLKPLLFKTELLRQQVSLNLLAKFEHIKLIVQSSTSAVNRNERVFFKHPVSGFHDKAMLTHDRSIAEGTGANYASRDSWRKTNMASEQKSSERVSEEKAENKKHRGIPEALFLVRLMFSGIGILTLPRISPAVHSKFDKMTIHLLSKVPQTS